MNTRIAYMYRDSANYKAHREAIVEGILSFKDVKKYTDSGEFFIPSEVGLDDLQEELRGFPSEDDHVWHELIPSEIAGTMQPATETITAKQLISNFRKAHMRGWPVRPAMKRLGIK
jgi:hypothetical protein